MGASRSKPSVSRASPPLTEPRSPPTPSVLAEETRDGARRSSGVLACIAPSEAAGPLRKRLRSALPEAGGGAKRMKDVGNGDVSDTALLNDDGEFQLASAFWTNEQEPESLLFSCQPLGAANAMGLGPSGSAHGVQPMSSFKLDGVKHKIFLIHSGAQKDFVEQLCVDFERMGYFFPFFDQSHHNLPKGKDFAPLIMEAARLCHVAVIVLSEEFLCSKWPMMELTEFYVAQQCPRGGKGKLKLFPLFFKLSIEEVKDEGRWMPIWKEHAACDDRIDLSKWSAAVKALCKSNGLDFGKFARKEVAYRKCVVESIFKLSPPDLLFDNSKTMVGCGRMCEAMSQQFVEDPYIGARVLGIYGMAGLGKTLLAKALHDYFYGEFLGKVCYLDMANGSRVGRQKWMLKMLCDFERDVLDCLGVDVEKGLMQMKTFMKRNQVFLVLDNITNDVHLVQEVQDYLRMGFHPESRILITSSSKAILEDLLPNIELYTPMPTLTVEEAGALFLKCAAPMKAISALTSEEQNILGICIRKCWFDSEESGFYHPMALTALANFFSRLGRAKGNQLLVWKDHLEKEMDLVKDVLKSSKDLFGILGLQFSTFDFTEKLLFLDLALYSRNLVNSVEDGERMFDWLCRLHDESPTIIGSKLLDLRKFGMIDFNHLVAWNYEVMYEMDYEWGYIEVPSLYKEFAKWYSMDHNVNGLKNAWGVFQVGGMNLRGYSLTPIKCWSNLIRLRINRMTLANARLVGSKKMQELSNLVVLQLFGCQDLTMLDLEGLDCLRELELFYLPKLVTVTLCRNSSKDEYVGIYDSLQHVGLVLLDSLVDMPDLRPCTSLHSIFMMKCQKVRNFEGVDCPCMKDLKLYDLDIIHFERLLDFDCLQSLEVLIIWARSDVDGFEGHWQQRVGKSDIGLEAYLEGEGPCAKLLKELLLLYGSNNISCIFFDSWEGEGEDREYSMEGIEGLMEELCNY